MKMLSVPRLGSFPVATFGEATLFTAAGLEAGRDGSLCLTDRSLQRVRRIGSDGVIAALAGQRVALTTPGAFGVDGGPLRPAGSVGGASREALGESARHFCRHDGGAAAGSFRSRGCLTFRTSIACCCASRAGRT
jgi:hypothetical protein